MPLTEKYLIKFCPIDNNNCFNEVCYFQGIDIMELYQHYRECHKEGFFRSPCLFSKYCFAKNIFNSFRALDKHTTQYHKSFFWRVRNEDTQNLYVQSHPSFGEGGDAKWCLL